MNFAPHEITAAREALRLHLATLHQAGLAVRLAEAAGEARRVFEAGPEAIGDRFELGPRALKKLFDPAWAERAKAEIERAREAGIRLLLRGAPGYPRPLAALPDMPLVLYLQGEWRAEDVAAVAIVGSRRPTPYGLRQARRFAEALARAGVTVVSGLARGIDRAAHESALLAGGRTVAVLGSGLLRVYPPEHEKLARRIAGGGRGALLSEFPLEAAPRSFHFPQRNRILSGLARAVLVVEAGERSGSLITVEWALAQGRPVLVVPGRVDQPEARGALRLLQEGAHPVLDPEDLATVEGLAHLAQRKPAARETTTAGPEAARRAGEGSAHGASSLRARIEALLCEEDALAADEIARKIDVPPSALLPELIRLELEGCTERRADGRWTLAR